MKKYNCQMPVGIAYFVIIIFVIMCAALSDMGESQFTITKEVCYEKEKLNKSEIERISINNVVLSREKAWDLYDSCSKCMWMREKVEEEYKYSVYFFGEEKANLEYLHYKQEVCEQVEVDEIEINLNSSYFEHIINLFLEKELSNKWFIGWLEENCECVGVIPEKSENKRIRWSNKCYKKYPFTSGEDVNYKKYNSCFGEKYFSCWDYNNTKTGFCESCSKYKCGEYLVEVK